MPSTERKEGMHELLVNDATHALLAHARLMGKAWQIELGVPAEEIKGTGARTTADLLIQAFAWKAGWKLERKQDEHDDQGTPNENAASTHTFTKRAGRPAGPGGGANAEKGGGGSKSELRSKAEYEQAICVLQKAWLKKRGRFTSRGTAIVAPKPAALVQVRRLILSSLLL